MILAPSQLFGDPAPDARPWAQDLPKGMITPQYCDISSTADNDHPGSVCWEIN